MTKLKSKLAIVHKFFEGMEVIEATANLHIQPTQEDIDSAIPEDPRNCLFSRACQRMYDSHTVLFFGTVAYVDLLGENGERKVHRFIMGNRAQRYIRDFDAGNSLSPRGFHLNAPCPTARRDTRNIYDAKHAEERRKALIKGETVLSKTPKPRANPKTRRLSMFRGGTGMAQFPPRSLNT